MNEVLRPFLRRFILVFFDDILNYNMSWSEHLQHVRLVFSVLQAHKLFMKRSMCSFGCIKVSYLGHVISAVGVSMDLRKVRAMLDWPVSESVRAVRAFLGLAGYYHRFIRDYGRIAAPLTKLTRKGGFCWDEAAGEAFRLLQRALTTVPVLQLPDFTRDFIVECDASGHGFGAMLHQGSGPVAFFSKPIVTCHAKLAAYEHELIGLVHVVRHWRAYLWGRSFIIKTDHYSLKILLDQRLSTIPQHHWTSMLLDYDFCVEFKPGASNVVADALSCHDTEAVEAVMALSGMMFHYLMICVANSTTLKNCVNCVKMLRPAGAYQSGEWLMACQQWRAKSSCHWPQLAC
jgi:hypothetical protein